MDFSAALTAMKNGARVRRAHYAPRGFVTLQTGYPQGIGINANTAAATGLPEGLTCAFAPYFMIRLPGTPSMPAFAPWTLTHGDVLAEDWEVYDGE